MNLLSYIIGNDHFSQMSKRKKLQCDLQVITSEPLDEISSAWYRWKALDLSFQIMIFSIFSIRGGARPGRPPLYEPLL